MCTGIKCEVARDNTPPTSFGEPYKPELPELPVLPTPITTTTKLDSPTTTIRKVTTDTTLYGDCIQPVCGDGICNEWEKKSDSILGTCYCLLNSGIFKTKAYSSLVGHVVCSGGGLNRNFCLKDCDESFIPEEPTTTTTTTTLPLPPVPEPPVIPNTTTTLKAVSNPINSPVETILDGFCGRQTSGSCSKDADCKASGCSGETCQAITDKTYIGTCE